MQFFFKSTAFSTQGEFPITVITEGRYEIDLVVLTRKQISAIEIKNWSGSVTSDGENWIQTRMDASKIVHSDPKKK